MFDKVPDIFQISVDRQVSTRKGEKGQPLKLLDILRHIWRDFDVLQVLGDCNMCFYATSHDFVAFVRILLSLICKIQNGKENLRRRSEGWYWNCSTCSLQHHELLRTRTRNLLLTLRISKGTTAVSMLFFPRSPPILFIIRFRDYDGCWYDWDVLCLKTTYVSSHQHVYTTHLSNVLTLWPPLVSWWNHGIPRPKSPADAAPSHARASYAARATVWSYIPLPLNFPHSHRESWHKVTVGA